MIAILAAVLVGYIAYRGIVGSTMTALAINVIQLISLVAVSILAIVFRLTHGGFTY